MRLSGVVLQTLGLESIILGVISYMAELWARHDWRADEEVPPRILVGMTEAIRALTHTSPLIVLTVLGALLIVAGSALRRQGSDG